MMEIEDIQYDIKAVNVFKSFGKNKIINGLNMNVQSGSIYGLLGSSGCGKSTILNCILGKISLDSGVINLRADHLSDVGYMPQALCLEDILTIKEILEFYGNLYSMTKEQIESRIQYLTEFLQLPDLNQLIKNISGGQCRRVSLALSIIHDPKIIILDEPTVGIDPLLRERVWDEFVRMVEHSKKTIIITTHYIEEATKANCIGFMRNGVIVEEGVPQNILSKYETNSLESTFLIICCKKEEHRIAPIDTQNVQQAEIVHMKNKHFTENRTTTNFFRIKTLIKKNLKMYSRDYMLLFTMFLLPIIQSLIFCFGVGINIKDLQIAVKNDEINLLDCGSSKKYECILDKSVNQRSSCIVMNYLLSHNYQLKEVKDFKEGETTVERYESKAFIYFPQNYTKDLSYYVGENRTNYDLGSSIHVRFAKENYIIRNQIMKDVTDSVKQLIENTLDSCSNNPKALNIPLDFDVVQGKEVKSHLNSAIAFFLITGGFYLSGSFAISVMMSEKFDGLFSRSMFAGVTIMELLISLFCFDTILYNVQMIIPLFIVYVWFSNPLLISGSLLLCFLILIIIGWIGFLFGISISVIFPSKLGGIYGLNGLFMSHFLLCGLIWPLEGQPLWLRTISELLPTTIAGHTINNMALKGWAWDHPSVVYGTTTLVVYLILLLLFLFGVNKVKKDAWIINK